MSDDAQQPDTDAYYGEEEIDSSEIDLSFLDENQATESGDASADDTSNTGQGA